MKMNYEELRSAATSFDQQGEMVGEVISRMDGLLGEIKGGWDGNAASAFEGKFDELKPGFQKAQGLINEIAGSLRQAASHMEEAENSVASSFK